MTNVLPRANKPLLDATWISAEPARRLRRVKTGSGAGITINGKFLGGSIAANGVHRTAVHFSVELIRRARGERPVHVLAPSIYDRSELAGTGLHPKIGKSLLGSGQAWEMLSLPCQARSDLLVNFCNLGPVLHPNSAVMIHDAQTLLFPSSYSKRQVQGYKMLWPLIGRRAKAILTVSEYSRQSLADLGIAPLNKIFVTPNGTDHVLNVKADHAPVTQLGLDGRPFALAIGSARYHKNIKVLLRAFHDPRLADIPLVLAGGPGRATYEEMGITLPANVVFAGRVNDAELRGLYTAAEVFLFPSLSEGFGLPPVEAMHCGTAVLASDGGAIPEVCGKGARFLPATDAEAWAEGVLDLMQDDAARLDLVRQSKARAAELSWTQAGDTLWNALKPLL